MSHNHRWFGGDYAQRIALDPRFYRAEKTKTGVHVFRPDVYLYNRERTDGEPFAGPGGVRVILPGYRNGMTFTGWKAIEAYADELALEALDFHHPLPGRRTRKQG
jgi:hypothetical protein